VSAERAQQVLELALSREQKEAGMKEAIARGATTVELMQLDETLRRLELN
jgi:regulator of RNase E activity RraA